MVLINLKDDQKHSKKLIIVTKQKEIDLRNQMTMKLECKLRKSCCVSIY